VFLRWIIVVVAFIAAGWIAFDGAHALVTGNYVTQRSGPHAGQLGPWSKRLTAMGLDPRSLFVKWLHLVIGTAWRGAIVAFAFRVRRAWGAMLVGAIAGLWYVPFGTLISLIVIGLLMLPGVRRQYVC